MKGAAFVLAALPATVEAACTKDGCIFSAVGISVNSGGPVRCGQVDAVPRMPDDIWNDTEAVELYVDATIRFWSYTGGVVSGYPLKQEECASRTETGRDGKQIGPFPVGPKGSETLNWVSPELMRLTCNAFCGCTYPDCPDVPDKPEANKYCSLCGPKFNAPAVISFYYESAAVVSEMNVVEPSKLVTKNIVQLAESQPNLSTLVTALVAAGLTSTLSQPGGPASKGPFTVLAPTNDAFKKLPTLALQALLKDKQLLTKVLEYHVFQGNFTMDDLAVLTDSALPVVRPLEGEKLRAYRQPYAPHYVVYDRSERVSVLTPNIAASNGIVHTINSVLIPPSVPLLALEQSGNSPVVV